MQKKFVRQFDQPYVHTNHFSALQAHSRRTRVGNDARGTRADLWISSTNRYLRRHPARDWPNIRRPGQNTQIRVPSLENSIDINRLMFRKKAVLTFKYLVSSKKNTLKVQKPVQKTVEDVVVLPLRQKQPRSWNVKPGKLIFQLKMNFSSPFPSFSIPGLTKFSMLLYVVGIHYPYYPFF